MSPDGEQKKKNVVAELPNDVFFLMCSVCGKTAASFGEGEILKERGYLYTGVTHQCALPESVKPTIIELLRLGNIRDLNKLVKSHVPMEDGIDVYCAECDLVYCQEELILIPEWDDGFYDCTYATCPKGHRWMCDD